MVFPCYNSTLYFGWVSKSCIYCAFTQEELVRLVGNTGYRVKVNGFMGLNTVKSMLKQTVGSGHISDKMILDSFVEAVRYHVSSTFVCVGYNKRTGKADILDTSDGVIESYNLIELLDIDKKFGLGIVSRTGSGIKLRRFDGKVLEVKG